MEATDRATARQVKLIESLYANLRIRNTSLYGGARPAQLTKQGASDVIDVLTLRKLSSQIGRPVAVDLTEPGQVREELARLEQLTDGHHRHYVAATADRNDQLREASNVTDESDRLAREVAIPQVQPLPSRHRRISARPRVGLTPTQLSARPAALDRERDARLDSPNRYTDVTGYGSTASFRSASPRQPSDAPQLTDAQERKIIELQEAGADSTVSSTVLEASDYLDQTFTTHEPLPPTERQLAYLHRLERQAGKTDEQLSNPGTRQAASRRIQSYLNLAGSHQAAIVQDQFAVAVSLTAAAMPHSAEEVLAVPPDLRGKAPCEDDPTVDREAGQGERTG